jgi:hypothetical protein
MTDPAARLAVLLLLLPSAAASAQGFSGFADVEGFGYFSRFAERDPWLEGWGTLFLKQEARLGKARFAVSGRAQALSSGGDGVFAFDPADRALRRTPFSIRELWVRLPLATSLDVTVGRFALGWGKTDGYSPADAFLPRDLTDPYADEKLPIWGVRLQGQAGRFRLDAVVSAPTTPWRLPILSGRFAPLPDPPVPGAYLVDGQSDPPPMGFGALRLLGTFGAWDLGAWGRVGVRPAPLLVFRADEAAMRPDGLAVPVNRRYAHEQAIGIELSRVLGPWVVRGELAALHSGDAELGDALVGTLGLERAFGDGTLLVTFAANARHTPVDALLLFDRAALPELIVAWNRSESWGSWKVVLAEALRHGDGLLKAEMTDAVTDAWSLTAGLDIPFGHRRGPYGSRPDTRRVRLGIRWSW